MRIIDCTHLTAGKHKKRLPGLIDKQVHHRSHLFPDHIPEETPEAMIEFFKDPAQGTGGTYPYHFYVLSDEIWQMVRLDEIANGARGANKNGVHVAWSGDFRKIKPSADQWILGCELARELFLRFDAPVFGHMEIKNASRDPNKICPGPGLDLAALRAYTTRGIK